MTNKIKTFSLLLAGTFLSSPAWADYNLTAADFGTSDNIKWTETTAPGENVVKVELPNNVVRYFHYEYIPQEGRTIYTERQQPLSGDINADFKDVSSTGNGGALLSTNNSVVGNINGDFIDNSSSNAGGAIYINTNSSIGNLKGDFVGSHAGGYGGAIRNDGIIGNIIGNFIANYGSAGTACGGGVYMATLSGNVKKSDQITGNFIANHLDQTSSNGYAKGGGLDLWRYDVGTIKGDFINNTITAANIGYGAAINIGNSQVGSISGNFVNNITTSEGYAAAALYIYSNEPDPGEEEHNTSIGSITGLFMNNSSVSGGDRSALGGAIYISTNSVINNLQADFYNNYAKSTGTGSAIGSAIYNSEGIIKNISGVFSGNYVEGMRDDSGYIGAYGGAIMNTGELEFISGKFENNHARNVSGASAAWGGAIYNRGTSVKIGNIMADFTGNYTQADSGISYGGAILNYGQSLIAGIKGKFIGNYVKSGAGSAFGGAIFNGTSAKIGNITADFTGNYAKGDGDGSQGGAIYNYNQSSIGMIKGNFTDNRSLSAAGMSNGGAIYNLTGTIAGIEGDFVGNYVESGGRASGGAINNNSSSEITNGITGNFRKNYAKASGNGSMARGGAIINFAKIGTVSGDFTDNYAASAQSSAVGGAVYNAGAISEFLNSNFIGNYVKGNEDSAGGAIWSDSDILITADAGTSLFSGNKANDKSNAIYMSGTEDAAVDLNLSALNKGTITFDDGIDGKNYNINVTGDGAGVVKFNNLVENVNDFTLSNNSVVHLGLNADIQTQNMSVASGSSLVGKNAVSSPIITVDVEVDKAANKVNSGAIHVADDVSGDYRILVNALNSDVLDNTEDAVVPFLFAPNDKENTSSSFSVARVIGSPYLWDGSVNSKGEESGSTWYLNLTDIVNPYYTLPTIAPEVIAGAGLHEAAIEQTRSVVRNIRTKVADGRVYCPGCGLYDYAWNNQQLRNVWVLAQGESATIDKPVKMDADIWGIEAGFDVQNDVNNTLGVFASYRKGEYDLSGKADKVHSNVGSEIDIDSYLAGLYYRYDKNMNWLFATVYGGVQQADAKTDDGIAKFDTDGIEFGAGIEAGHTFALSSDLTLDPSLGLYYTQVNFDDAKDNVGKEYDWKDVKHLEAELGAKLEKQIDYAKIYVKPSVIQTITSGDSVKITGLNKLSTYDDQTLGRIELGGRYGFTDALSAYGWVNYTFGSGYDATAFGAGVNYAW